MGLCPAKRYLVAKIELGGQQLFTIQPEFYVDMARPGFIDTRQDGAEAVDPVCTGQRFAIELEIGIPSAGIGVPRAQTVLQLKPDET